MASTVLKAAVTCGLIVAAWYTTRRASRAPIGDDLFAVALTASWVLCPVGIMAVWL